jgi:hypothetical protein
MEPVIPLISSGVAGPLGILHLPRLWQKALLAALGRDHPDYPSLAPGYDLMVLEAFGIPADEFRAFIEAERPTYPRCESWIVGKLGGRPDPAMVRRLNGAIAGYHHKDGIRQAILEANGIADDGSLPDAVNLNNLDDWLAFRNQLVGA